MNEVAPTLTEAQRIARSLIDAGLVKHQAGDLDCAMDDYRQVLAISPEHPDVFYLMGKIHHRRGAPNHAADLIEYALNLNPRQADYAVELGKVRASQDRWVDAAAAFRRALELRPEHADTQCQLAAALMWQGRAAAAEETIRAVLEHDATHAPSWSTLGEILVHRGDKTGAILAWEKAISLRHDLPEAHYGLATSRLAAGDFVRGWMDFSWRSEVDDGGVSAREVGVPRWRGQPLAGKSLLLIGEQDLDDQILFASLVPELVKRAARLFLVVDPSIAVLCARSFRGATVLPRTAPLSDIIVDYYCPIGDLGAHLRTSMDQFPVHDGYLRADPTAAVEVRSRYRRFASSRRLVGISWRDARRRDGPFKSTDLAENWGPILRTPGVAFVNLQQGSVDSSLAKAADAHGIAIHHNAADTVGEDGDLWAARIGAVDLVISVSNPVAHLAGAMNRPVWTLSPTGAGQPWYWFENRPDSPWYPAMRLYRQVAPGDWTGVMDQVAADLALWAKG